MICQPLGHLLGLGSRVPGPGFQTQDPGPGLRTCSLDLMNKLQPTFFIFILLFIHTRFLDLANKRGLTTTITKSSLVCIKLMV